MSGIHKKQVNLSFACRRYGGTKRFVCPLVLFFSVSLRRYMPAFEKLQPMAFQKTPDLLGAALHPAHLPDAFRGFPRGAGRLLCKVFQQALAVLFQRTFVRPIVVGE